VQKCQIIIDGKRAERIYAKNGKKGYRVLAVFYDGEERI